MDIARLKGRPKKKKIVQAQPGVDHFSPGGRPGRPEESLLSVEEYEAIRLHDYINLQQKDAAVMMGISQQSFSRLVRDGRRKVADALVNAKILRIEGGDFINMRAMKIAEKLKRKRS